MTYKPNEEYTFRVRGLQVDFKNGKEFVEVFDPADESHLYRIYNLFKGQITNLPETLPVKVSKTDIFGKTFFRQDDAKILNLQYEKDGVYEFRICDQMRDYNSNRPDSFFYVVEDDFAQHRYYSRTMSEDIGDVIQLQVKRIDDRGHLVLELPKDVDKNATPTNKPITQKSIIDSPQSHSYPVFKGGDEGTKLEYKSSIAFPPENDGKADIDTQLFTIVKEIAAFLNAEGGSLYIGIRDTTREIVGISADFPYLNDGDDRYNGSYKENRDGYELKIRNAVNRHCNGLANNLIEFKFAEQDGKTYCEIQIKPSPRPIWVKGNLLITRTGNRIKTLNGEEITTFVYSKSSIAISQIIDTEDLGSFSADSIVEELKKSFRDILQERRRQIAASQAINTASTPPKFYLIWYLDGTWRWQRDQSADPNIFYQGAVFDDNGFVVFCYESGTINKVSIKQFKHDGRRKALKINTLGTNGFDPANKPSSIFIALSTDFISVYSSDIHGSEYIKVHALADFNETASSKNQGPRIIPKGCTALGYKLVFSSDRRKVRGLIVAKTKTASFAGFVIDSPQLTDEINFIFGRQ